LITFGDNRIVALALWSICGIMRKLVTERFIIRIFIKKGALK